MASIECDFSGVDLFLKEELKRCEEDTRKEVNGIMGLAEGVAKNAVPVDKGFLKNSIYSQRVHKLEWEFRFPMVYARIRNYVNKLHPDRKGYLEKTYNYIKKKIEGMK